MARFRYFFFACHVIDFFILGVLILGFFLMLKSWGVDWVMIACFLVVIVSFILMTIWSWKSLEPLAKKD